MRRAFPDIRAVALLALLAVPLTARAQRTIEVAPGGPVATIAEGVRLARAGDRVLVHAGTYREPTVTIDRPLVLEGTGWPTLDGEQRRELLRIAADDVTVRGMRFANTGTSMVEDRAAVRAAGVKRCTIAGNRVDDAFFGIYLAETEGCRVTGNVLRARGRTETTSGNGIHLWTAAGATVSDNRIVGHRDGIYLEFARESVLERNTSEGNLRYGLHFMFSDGNRYARNVFRRNGSGVAVMFTNRVEMIENRFEDNWGAAAYGLLLKDIVDSRLEGNTFARNTTALLADGANRLEVQGNTFTDNGWAVRLEASTQDARFTRNEFSGNTFDVASNSRMQSSTFANNWWDAYRGYDLDHDGVGDVPHRPVRLFSLLVERHAPTLVLLRSAFVTLLDAAERLLPALTPETLVDATPSMWRDR